MKNGYVPTPYDDDAFMRGIRETVAIIKSKEWQEVKKEEDRRSAMVYTPNHLKKYGLTQHDYDQMNEEQDGLCAICHEENVNGRDLYVDHNHDTGKVRGLLCSSCNTGLGFMKDNPRRLFGAAEYLMLYGEE